MAMLKSWLDQPDDSKQMVPRSCLPVTKYKGHLLTNVDLIPSMFFLKESLLLFNSTLIIIIFKIFDTICLL